MRNVMGERGGPAIIYGEPSATPRPGGSRLTLRADLRVDRRQGVLESRVGIGRGYLGKPHERSMRPQKSTAKRALGDLLYRHAGASMELW